MQDALRLMQVNVRPRLEVCNNSMKTDQASGAREQFGGPIATASDIRAIVGRISDDRLAAILALRPSPAQVTEAFTWLTSDEYLGATLERRLSGVVAEIHELLKPERPDIEEDRPRSS